MYRDILLLRRCVYAYTDDLIMITSARIINLRIHIFVKLPTKQAFWNALISY